VVVADSSPLIYLSRVGVLDLLSAVFGDLVVPRAVWNEVVERRPSVPGLDALRQASWIRVVDSPLPQIDLGLDPGETAAILLAEALHADLRLIDERLGRRVARARGIVVRGTLCSSRRGKSGRCRYSNPFSLLWWPRDSALLLPSSVRRSRKSASVLNQKAGTRPIARNVRLTAVNRVASNACRCVS